MTSGGVCAHSSRNSSASDSVGSKSTLASEAVSVGTPRKVPVSPLIVMTRPTSPSMCCTPFANTVTSMLLPDASAILSMRREVSVPFTFLGAVTTPDAATSTPSTCTCVPAASCPMAAMDTNEKL